MGFHVGQRVVCVVDWEEPAYPDEIFPKLGVLYTVRSVDLNDDVQYLRLHEIVNLPHFYEEGGFGEPNFEESGFLPITERKTDISVFTAMLIGAPKEMERVDG